jgi:MarR family 2-MHQ and catechol resistance regulon transcriptional repressor
MFGVRDRLVAEAVRTYVKLLRATHAVLAQIEPMLAREGLTPTQLGVLEALLHKGPMTHRDLGRKVLTSAGNMSDLIDKLEARGLVRRVRCTEDRRIVRVALTPCGAARIEALFPRHAADVARAMGGLDDAELAQLGDLLRKLGTAAQHAAVPHPCGGGGGEPDCRTDRSISND